MEAGGAIRPPIFQMINEKIEIADLYQEFREPLKGFISKRISDETSAEDILHDVFVKIHSQIDSLKDKEKLAPWIYSIARNAITDVYRKRRIQVDIREDLVQDAEQWSVASEKLVPMVRSMIDRLPEKYKSALLLSDFEGLKLTDVAQQLNLSLPGVKSRVQRARKMVKDLLLECCHFEFDRYGTVFDYHPKNCTHCCSENKEGKSC